MIKLSIIIPVYNTEAYLRRCLDSCLHQDLPMDQYEIIAVNDGSTDRSLEILKDYERQYTNIHVYSQENKRQGAARNYGLTKASGEYIWFVDADDWIANNCLRKLSLSLDGIDIFIFPGFWSDNENVYSKFCCSHMLVNNETGEIFSVNNFFKKAKYFKMFTHCDMTQALGNLKIDMSKYEN